MEPYSRFMRCIFQWERFLLIGFGHNFLDGQYQRNWLTYSIHSLNIFSAVVAINTFFNYDTATKLFSLYGFSLSVQGIIKLYTFRYVDEYEWLINFIRNLFKLHHKSELRDRVEFFRMFSLFTEILFKITIGLYTIGCLVLFLFALCVYIATGELIPIIPFFIPGVDETTPIGYTIHLIYHVTVMAAVVFGFGGFDFLIAILITSSLIFSKLISIDLKQMNAELKDKNSKMINVIGRFRNVLLMHREMGEYMERTARVTLATFFIQIGCAFCGAMIWLYAILVIHYLPAIVLGTAMLFQIFIACLLGQFVEVSHDQIYAEIKQLDWNELPIKYRHFYKFFTQRCQNPALLAIGGFMPLNMNTCIIIFSKIYSTTMIFYRMVE